MSKTLKTSMTQLKDALCGKHQGICSRECDITCRMHWILWLIFQCFTNFWRWGEHLEILTALAVVISRLAEAVIQSCLGCFGILLRVCFHPPQVSLQIVFFGSVLWSVCFIKVNSMVSTSASCKYVVTQGKRCQLHSFIHVFLQFYW